jgi:short-subunit dehydrogenase
MQKNNNPQKHQTTSLPFQFVIVTGASSGIGQAIAESLAKRGAHLLLVARRVDRLEALRVELEKKYSVQVKCLSLDLTTENVGKTLVDYCLQQNFPIEALVNNAGFGSWGRFDTMSEADIFGQIKLNNEALVELTHAVLPYFLKAKKGYLLNVGSIASYQAIPTFAIYAATKSFVLSFTRALHHELKPQGITVTLLSPGATASEFIDRAGLEHARKKAEKVEMSCESVAELAVQGWLKGKIEVVPGAINQLTELAAKFLPKRFIESTAAKVYKV